MAILLETIHTNLPLPGNLIEYVKYADVDMYPNIRVLLIIGCKHPVSSADLWLATNQVISQKQDHGLMSGCQDLHS